MDILPTENRWMIRRDFSSVLRIDTESFADPWTADDLETHLRMRECIGMVATAQELVVGFQVYLLEKSELHLLRMAVDPLCRRHRVASQMIDRLSTKLSATFRKVIVVGVPERYLEAQMFFRAKGFMATRTLRGDSGDLYWMEFRFPSEPANRIAKFGQSSFGD